MKYMNNMFITKPIRAVTPMTTPTPSLSKSVKSNSLMFDGSKFEKQDVVLRNIIDELQLKLLLDLFFGSDPVPCRNLPLPMLVYKVGLLGV